MTNFPYVRLSSRFSRWPARLVCGHDALITAHDVYNLSGAPCRQCPRTQRGVIRMRKIVAIYGLTPEGGKHGLG